MTITNGYCTLGAVTARIMDGAKADPVRDGNLELIIQAVSRAIDNETGRIFYLSTPASARVFTATNRERVYTDWDMVTISSVTVDLDGDGTYETTLSATTDYWAYPINDAPKSWLQIRPFTSAYFPCYPNAVQITSTWGFASVPDPITQAAILQTSRIWARRMSPLGVVTTDLGTATVIDTLDPDVSRLIAPYRRLA